MWGEQINHDPAHTLMNTGSILAGRPSMGSWVLYGLGAETENLPGFVVVNAGLIPPGGLDCFSNGFLPATYQGKAPATDTRCSCMACSKAACVLGGVRLISSASTMLANSGPAKNL